jgi:hypothetical protein
MDAMGDQRGDNSKTLVPPPNLVENFCDEFGTAEAFSDEPFGAAKVAQASCLFVSVPQP